MSVSLATGQIWKGDRRAMVTRIGDNYPPVLAFGAGVNSTALAIILVRKRWKGFAVFADTGTEWPETYEFMETFRPILESNGIQFVRLGPEYRSRRYSLPLIEAAEQYRMIPLAKARWCTTEYKIRPLQRWCRKMGFDSEKDVMIAIAADESHRQPGKIRPLVDAGITRTDCVRIITDFGLPIPPKSGCWMCPFQSKVQWRALRLLHPDLFQRALMLEQIAGCTFDPSGEHPLAEYVRQEELFDWSEFYQPCLCRT